MTIGAVSAALPDLLTCVEAAVDPPPCVSRIMAGDPNTVSFDVCTTNAAGDDGQLWVQAHRAARHAATNPKCLRLIQQVDVGLIRCAETVDDDGTVPADVDLTAEALAVLDDADDMLAAIRCCWIPSVRFGVDVVEWTPIGPEGGCVGGRWRLQANFDVCRCPEGSP